MVAGRRSGRVEHSAGRASPRRPPRAFGPRRDPAAPQDARLAPPKGGACAPVPPPARRRMRLRSLGPLLASGLALGTWSCSLLGGRPEPNLLIVAVDSLRFDAISL